MFRLSEDAKKQRLLKLHSIAGMKVLDENITLMDYKADYHLDELLAQGVKSIPDLLKFIAKYSDINEALLSFGSQKGGGCTSFSAATPEGDHLLSRNFDFKIAPSLIVWTHPKGHYASVGVVDNNTMLYGSYVHKIKKGNLQALLAPYCIMDGVNEKGVAICVLQIKAKATNQTNPEKRDITTTTFIRAVLDTCANVDEAVELLSKYNMHDSLFCCYHYQISDASGRSVICEYIDNELHIYEKGKYGVEGSHFEDDDIKETYACNFSLTKDIGDFKVEQHGDDRIAAVKEVLKNKDGVLTELQAMDLLQYVKLDYDHPKYPWKILALWSAVYNLQKCTLKIAANDTYSKVYTFSATQPYKILELDDVSDSEYDKGNWQYI